MTSSPQLISLPATRVGGEGVLGAGHWASRYWANRHGILNTCIEENKQITFKQSKPGIDVAERSWQSACESEGPGFESQRLQATFN